MRHTAIRKVWVTEDRTTLVPDGHEDARVLIAREGQSLDSKELVGYANAHEFFDGLAPQEAPDPMPDDSGFESPADDDNDPQPKGKKRGRK